MSEADFRIPGTLDANRWQRSFGRRCLTSKIRASSELEVMP
jgi:hypothetical protein